MNKKQQKKHIPNFYFAHPTLVDLLRKNDNPKSISDLAGMEYSNFMKTCKIDRNMGIETISKCANAFGMDVIMILIPKDVIAENIKPSLSANKAYNTIEREDLIYILNRLCRIDRKRMEQHVKRNWMPCSNCNKNLPARKKNSPTPGIHRHPSVVKTAESGTENHLQLGFSEKDTVSQSQWKTALPPG